MPELIPFQEQQLDPKSKSVYVEMALQTIEDILWRRLYRYSTYFESLDGFIIAGSAFFDTGNNNYLTLLSTTVRAAMEKRIIEDA